VIGQRRTLAFGCGVAAFNCWDNAVAESFFSTLKLDLLHRYSWPTRAAARSAIFEFTDVFYDRQHRHSTLGNRVRQTTNPTTPLCARPNKRVRQSGSGPGH
jgi:transposase InsO family protein